MHAFWFAFVLWSVLFLLMSFLRNSATLDSHFLIFLRNSRPWLVFGNFLRPALTVSADEPLRSPTPPPLPHLRLRPNSSRLVGTSVQPRVSQYASTTSNGSPAHHSHHPTMGRRHRRQPVNPPRCSPSCSRRFKPRPLLSQAQAVTCLKTTRYKARRL